MTAYKLNILLPCAQSRRTDGVSKPLGFKRPLHAWEFVCIRRCEEQWLRRSDGLMLHSLSCRCQIVESIRHVVTAAICIYVWITYTLSTYFHTNLYTQTSTHRHTHTQTYAHTHAVFPLYRVNNGCISLFTSSDLEFLIILDICYKSKNFQL